MNALYRIKDIAAHINKEAYGKVMVFVLKNGIYRLRLGFKVVINRPVRFTFDYDLYVLCCMKNTAFQIV